MNCSNKNQDAQVGMVFSDQAIEIFDHLFDAVIALDKFGNITYVNQIVERFFKIDREQLINRTYHVLLEYSDTYKLDGFSIFRETLLQGKKFYNVEIHVTNQLGEDVVIKGKSLPIYNEDGQITGVSGVFRDITNEKEQEEQHRRWEEKFKQAEKLAVVGEMAAGIAHEIKNPLGTIKGFLQLLEKEKLSKMKRKEYFKIIKEEIFRLEKIVRESLQLVKPNNQTKKNEQVLLCNLMHKALTFMYPQFKKRNTEVTIVCEGYPIWLDVDYDRLQQVFINLIKNGLEAMDKVNEYDRHLIIELSIDNCEKSKLASEQEKMVMIKFIDNGPGIPDSIIDKLFSPFATTKTSGTGLGLPVSMQIIQNFNGYLDAYNSSDGGACFQIELPIKAIEKANHECNTECRSYCERVSGYDVSLEESGN